MCWLLYFFIFQEGNWNLAAPLREQTCLQREKEEERARDLGESACKVAMNESGLMFYAGVACSGRPLSAKQLLMGDNVSAPVAADALYTALDDLMARAGALSAERR